jgi:hypothetical protein
VSPRWAPVRVATRHVTAVTPVGRCFCRCLLRTGPTRPPHNVHSTTNSLQRTAYNIQPTTYNTQHTTYNVPITPCSLQRTRYIVPSTMYSSPPPAYQRHYLATLYPTQWVAHIVPDTMYSTQCAVPSFPTL